MRANEIVYTFQIPLPRDDHVLRMHRFFQTMTAILHLQIIFPETSSSAEYVESTSSHAIGINVKLAHHKSSQYDDDWTVFANRKSIQKQFTCAKSPYSLDCDMVELFELGSVHHEFYAINMQLDEKTSEDMLSALKSTSNINKIHELPEARLTLTVFILIS